MRTAGELPRILGWLSQFCFQWPSFVAQMPDVLVAAVGLFLGYGYRHVVRLGVIDSIFPRLDRPFPPGGDYFQMRGERLVGQLESHLVIAFTRAAMRQGVRPARQGHFHLAPGEHWPR